MQSKNLLVAAFLASTAAGAMAQAQPYSPAPNGVKSRNTAADMKKAKAKKKMADASRRRNRK